MEVVPPPSDILDEAERMALVADDQEPFGLSFNEYAIAVKVPKGSLPVQFNRRIPIQWREYAQCPVGRWHKVLPFHDSFIKAASERMKDPGILSCRS